MLTEADDSGSDVNADKVLDDRGAMSQKLEFLKAKATIPVGIYQVSDME